jgi:hypothetical protein
MATHTESNEGFLEFDDAVVLPMNDSNALGRIHTVQKTGEERFHLDDADLSCTVRDFWRWSTSDLVSNATRGILAEFIIARALGISTIGVRDEWAAYDLRSEADVTIEVRSAAYLQSWAQRRLSLISFSVRRSYTWDAETNTQSLAPLRSADVYVFALLAHQDKATLDPLDLDQWRFYVMPTAVLNQRTRSQHSITLPSLEKMNAGPHRVGDLRVAVDLAAQHNVQA